jgi:hypothetical protein
MSISFLVVVNHLAVGRPNVWFGSGWKNWQSSWISDVHSLVIMIKDIHGIDISIPIPLGLAKGSIFPHFKGGFRLAYMYFTV